MSFCRNVLCAVAASYAVSFAIPAWAEPPGAIQVAQAKTAKSFDIEIRNRKVVGENVIRVNQGDEVRLTWTTDEPAELHLHGYDVEIKAVPGKPAVMDFTARASGRFPVEAHGFGGGFGRHGESALLYIEVLPK